jgi:hypothetical protein
MPRRRMETARMNRLPSGEQFDFNKDWPRSTDLADLLKQLGLDGWQYRDR